MFLTSAMLASVWAFTTKSRLLLGRKLTSRAQIRNGAISYCVRIEKKFVVWVHRSLVPLAIVKMSDTGGRFECAKIFDLQLGEIIVIRL